LRSLRKSHRFVLAMGIPVSAVGGSGCSPCSVLAVVISAFGRRSFSPFLD
jgi:hypothetical protein